MVRKGSETIVPLDIQETIIDPSTERRRTTTLMEAMKKFSRTKLSTPHLDQMRKPFFALTKSSKVNIEPWPSATNLVHLPDRQKADTTFLRKSERDSAVRRTESFNIPVIDIRRASEDDPEDKDDEEEEDDDDDTDDDDDLSLQQGIINSAFSQERISESSSRICNCNAVHFGDVNSDVCQFECRHEKICQHLESGNQFRVTRPDFPRRRLHSYPKLLTHKRKSSEGGRWKKGVRWKPSGNKSEGKKNSRRRTVDSIPSAKKLVAESKDSLNLSTSENNLALSSGFKKCNCSFRRKESTDEDSPNERECNTKL